MSELHIAPEAPLPPVMQGKRKKDKKVPAPLMFLAFILVAGVGYFTGVVNGTYGGDITRLVGSKELDLSSVQEVYQQLTKNFDGDLSDQALIEGASRGMVAAAGDHYTEFMNAKESTEFDSSLTGNIGGGIGVEVGMRNGVPTVVRVLQDNPALKAGVVVNDIIIKVNDDSTEGKTLNEVVSKIRGESGTSVKLTVVRGSEEKTFSITRENVNNPSAYGEVKGDTGILTITRFDDETGSLARGVANDFVKQDVKKVILDLRGNGGGYVTAAQAVAGIWLDSQIVTTERSNGKVTEELKSTGEPILKGMPTTILVNESSASASEIVAGALRDYGVAKLVGATTFGKGSVQKLIKLSDQSMLKVTIARWYTPKGVNISEKGIQPDKAVELTIDDLNANRDPQLDAAMAGV